MNVAVVRGLSSRVRPAEPEPIVDVAELNRRFAARSQALAGPADCGWGMRALVPVHLSPADALELASRADQPGAPARVQALGSALAAAAAAARWPQVRWPQAVRAGAAPGTDELVPGTPDPAAAPVPAGVPTLTLRLPAEVAEWLCRERLAGESAAEEVSRLIRAVEPASEPLADEQVPAEPAAASRRRVRVHHLPRVLRSAG